jgi:hypothetical protein
MGAGSADEGEMNRSRRRVARTRMTFIVPQNKQRDAAFESIFEWAIRNWPLRGGASDDALAASLRDKPSLFLYSQA